MSTHALHDEAGVDGAHGLPGYLDAGPRHALHYRSHTANILDMSDQKPKRDYTAYQQKAIKRYYDNIDTIALQRLADLVGELYLAQGKKKEKAWNDAAAAMEKLSVPAWRIKHLLDKRDPALVAELVKELG